MGGLREERGGKSGLGVDRHLYHLLITICFDYLEERTL